MPSPSSTTTTTTTSFWSSWIHRLLQVSGDQEDYFNYISNNNGTMNPDDAVDFGNKNDLIDTSSSSENSNLSFDRSNHPWDSLANLTDNNNAVSWWDNTMDDTSNATLVWRDILHSSSSSSSSTDTASTSLDTTLFWTVNGFLLLLVVLICAGCCYFGDKTMFVWFSPNDEQRRQQSDEAYRRTVQERRQRQQQQNLEPPAQRTKKLLKSFVRNQVQMVRGFWGLDMYILYYFERLVENGESQTTHFGCSSCCCILFRFVGFLIL
jgi:hypothetical protein